MLIPKTSDKKALLINASSPSSEVEFNIGLGYIASALAKAEIKVRTLCDDLFQYEDIAFARELKRNNEFIFCISAMSASLEHVIRYVRIIKELNPESIVILGGLLATTCPEFALRKTNADIACIGAGEESIVLLINAIYENQPLADIPNIAYKKEGHIFFTENAVNPKSICAGERPYWDAFPMDRYLLSPAYYPFTDDDRVMNIITARGCPFSCNFCYHYDSFMQRDIEDVLDEMQYLMKTYHINGFYIEDDLLMSSEKRVIEFCEGIIRRNLRIKYTVTGRFNIVNQTILEALKKTGCITIFYGGESGDQKILDNMKKGINIDQIYNGVHMTRQMGIFCRVGFMFGQPLETLETLNNTLNLIKNLAYGNYEERYIYGCIPFPKSELYNYCIENALLKDEEDFFKHFSFQKRILDQIPVNMTSIDGNVNELLQRANKSLADFYLNNRSKSWYNLA